MTPPDATQTKPAAPKGPKVNRIGLPQKAYRGSNSTLCKGCGHDVITNAIIAAFYEMGVEPHTVAKLSGIGCSSKTPAYFLGQSWGFNAVHGRMPSIATGAAVANRKLLAIGVSGDGDTASIGMGQFVHLLRRNVPLIYICENNGVYGLTKGQFSATADEGSKLKNGTVNGLPPIDLCAMAVTLGCGFVARAFSADRKQLVALLKAAIAFDGTCLIDVMSPCVTFNNHVGSTRSYDWGRDHQGPVNEVGFVPAWEAGEANFEDGEVVEMPIPHGGKVYVKRIDEALHDPRDKQAAMQILAEDYHDNAIFHTGLMYMNPGRESLQDEMNMSADALCHLPAEKLRPSLAVLDEIVESLR